MTSVGSGLIDWALELGMGPGRVVWKGWALVTVGEFTADTLPRRFFRAVGSEMMGRSCISLSLLR